MGSSLLLEVGAAGLDLLLSEARILLGARGGSLEAGDICAHLGLVDLGQLVGATAAHRDGHRSDRPVPARLAVLELHRLVVVGETLPPAEIGPAAAVLALLRRLLERADLVDPLAVRNLEALVLQRLEAALRSKVLLERILELALPVLQLVDLALLVRMLAPQFLRLCARAKTVASQRDGERDSGERTSFPPGYT